MNLVSKQLNFDLYGEMSAPRSATVANAIEKLSASAGTAARGAVFTRPEVVDFILDLAGYSEDQALHQKRLLEPSFGGGDFLLPIVRRLLTAWRAAKQDGSALEELGDALRGVELHRETFQITRAAVISLLKGEVLLLQLRSL